MKDIVNNNIGKFKVKIKYSNGNKYEQEFAKLSQEELADGWIQVLPRINKINEIHHFNISLAELPPHLWKYLNLTSLLNNDDNIITISDKIFRYSIQKIEHNIIIYNLYLEINSRYGNNNKILELYNYCKNNKIHGWIMIKAKQILSDSNE